MPDLEILGARVGCGMELFLQGKAASNEKTASINQWQLMRRKVLIDGAGVG